MDRLRVKFLRLGLRVSSVSFALSNLKGNNYNKVYILYGVIDEEFKPIL